MVTVSAARELIRLPYVNWKGKRIFYRSTAPTSYNNTVICIHGAGGNSRHWSYQLTMASQWGHSIVAVDLPGHGQSEGPPLETISDYSRFVEEFIQLLKLERPVLAGHSMGGAITMELASRQPELVAKLILIGTADQFMVAPWLLESLQAGEMPPAFIRLAYAGNADGKLIEQGIKEAERTPVSVYLTDFLACQAFRLSKADAMTQIPCLLLFGAEDRLTPLKKADSLRKALHPHRLVVIEKAGHMVMIEKADPVNRAIEEFLQV
ncbi:MAG: alpha/beta hydrolase [Clostridia bacterium]|nr:alpha/beta hydrolase [Clostridia bacterium]